jgi:hypothetical protein
MRIKTDLQCSKGSRKKVKYTQISKCGNQMARNLKVCLEEETRQKH